MYKIQDVMSLTRLKFKKNNLYKEKNEGCLYSSYFILGGV